MCVCSLEANLCFGHLPKFFQTCLQLLLATNKSVTKLGADIMKVREIVNYNYYMYVYLYLSLSLSLPLSINLTFSLSLSLRIFSKSVYQ